MTAMPGETVLDDKIDPAKLSDVFARLFKVLSDRMGEFVESCSDAVCEIGFVSYDHFVAGARRGPCGKYGVYMDASVPLQLFDCFRCLLSHPATLQDALPRPAIKFRKPRLLLFNELLETGVNGPTDDLGRLGDIRQCAAQTLAVKAMQLLWMHELGHIEGGHFEFRDRVGPIAANIRRGLEHLADWKAAESCMAVQALSPIQSTWEELNRIQFRLLGFAAGILWELEGAHAASSKRSTYYPRAEVRRLACQAFIATSQLSKRLLEMLPSDGTQQFVQGMEEGQQAWKCIGWPTGRCPSPDDMTGAMWDVQLATQALAAQSVSGPETHPLSGGL